jgi:hypothetical protein
MARVAKPEQTTADIGSFDTDITGASAGAISVGPGSKARTSIKVKKTVKKKPPSALWALLLVLVGVAGAVYFFLYRCVLSPWDGAVRGWARTGQCASPDATGYFLRVSYKQDKDASFREIKRAWRAYVDEYYDIAGGRCPGAKEIVFFDAQRNAGAGILFAAVPPGWTQLLKDHPEWVPLGADDQPVATEVCFFRASESRKPTTGGW